MDTPNHYSIPTTHRAMALDLSVKASRLAAVLDKPWATGTKLDELPEHLADMAECALRLRRHVIEMRSAAGAEEEIRIFADQLARIMQTRCPLLFGDYVEQDGAWNTDHRKV